MTSANVEVVYSIFEGWERGDFSSAEWADPDIEFVIADGPSPGRFDGLAEMAEGWRGFLSDWEDWRTTPETYGELEGERVLVFLEHSGRGKISGFDLGPIRTQSANVFEFRDGKVTRFVAYWDRERALSDLGADAPPASAMKPMRAIGDADVPGGSRDGWVGEVLVGADQLHARVRGLAGELSRDYEGRTLLLVGILKGAAFFVADLMRQLTVDCELDFMALASYGSSTDSSGVVRILKDLDEPIEGRDVLIVEDIVDSGLTLQYLLRTLEARQPASLEVCALLTKPERRKVELPIRYVGFEIENRFVIGYGLDYAQRYRHLPYVAVLEDA